jgi:hypothetical protein
MVAGVHGTLLAIPKRETPGRPDQLTARAPASPGPPSVRVDLPASAAYRRCVIDDAAHPRIPCLGCGGMVPDIDGPAHRYMLASPGCWETFTELLASGGAAAPGVHGTLVVDAYAVQHPGEPGPQATQSVWVHLVTLHLALERGWPASRLVRIRQLAADRSAGWPWLAPPASMGAVTAIDLRDASPGEAPDLVRRWVEGAWHAWEHHHDAARETAGGLVGAPDR